MLPARCRRHKGRETPGHVMYTNLSKMHYLRLKRTNSTFCSNILLKVMHVDLQVFVGPGRAPFKGGGGPAPPPPLSGAEFSEAPKAPTKNLVSTNWRRRRQRKNFDQPKARKQIWPNLLGGGPGGGWGGCVGTPPPPSGAEL